MPRLDPPYEFLHYLAAARPTDGTSEPDRLPSLSELSKELGISVASLREQLEVAKALGLVEVRPRTGIRRLAYTFLPTVRQSLAYALERDRQNFVHFSELRNRLESAYWHDAVALLTPEDHETLKSLVKQAWEKLEGQPIRLPHAEHRCLHMCIFSRLENPFVQGILEAYWDAYETVGFNVYADLEYLQTVWKYHQEMVDAICSGDAEAGYRALVEHKKLLYHHPQNEKNNGQAFFD